MRRDAPTMSVRVRRQMKAWLGGLVFVFGGCDELPVEPETSTDLEVTIESDTLGMVGTTTVVDLTVSLNGLELTGVSVRWEPFDPTTLAVRAGADLADLSADASTTDTLDTTLFAEVTFLERGTHWLKVLFDSVGTSAVQEDSVKFVLQERWQGVSAGVDHTCAVTFAAASLAPSLREGGEVFCWGGGSFGALGTGSGGVTGVPTRVVSDVTFDQVQAGDSYTCAQDDIDFLHCWGDNAEGNLGLGNRLDQYIPRLVALGAAFTSFGVGNDSWFTCAIEIFTFPHSPGDPPLSGPGETLCWGENGSGELGCGDLFGCDPLGITQPNTVVVLSVARADDTRPIFQRLSLGYEHACGVETDGTVLCWGSNSFESPWGDLIGALGVPEAFDDGGFAVPIQSGDEFPEVAAGGGFTCGLGPGSVGVFCWGQMGAGPGSIDPVAVAGLQTETLSALTAGAAHACALRGGDAFCWGLNSLGQLGNSTQTDSYMVAVPVSSGLEFSSVSAGRSHTCAIGVEELVLAGEQRPDPRGSGAIYCWGDNTDGKLGNGTLSGFSNIPVRVIEPGG